jgi:hypothetical protein
MNAENNLGEPVRKLLRDQEAPMEGRGTKQPFGPQGENDFSTAASLAVADPWEWTAHGISELASPLSE